MIDKLKKEQFIRLFDVCNILAFLIIVVNVLLIKIPVARDMAYYYSTICIVVIIVMQLKNKKKTERFFSRYFIFLIIATITKIFIYSVIKEVWPDIIANYHEAYGSVVIEMSLFKTVLLAPLREEFLFRYLPKRYFEKNSIVYYLLSVVLFSYLHCRKEFAILILLRIPTAFVYAYAYRKTDDITLSTRYHMLNNLIV